MGDSPRAVSNQRKGSRIPARLFNQPRGFESGISSLSFNGGRFAHCATWTPPNVLRLEGWGPGPRAGGRVGGERVDSLREGDNGAGRDLPWALGPGGRVWVGWGRGGGERGKRKESWPVGADRLLEHGSTGKHRGVESGSQPKSLRDKRPRWVSDDGG